jgi:hypothetical protein
MRGRLLSAETRLNVLHRRKGPLTTKSLQRSWSFEHKLLAIAKAQLWILCCSFWVLMLKQTVFSLLSLTWFPQSKHGL